MVQLDPDLVLAENIELLHALLLIIILFTQPNYSIIVTGYKHFFFPVISDGSVLVTEY